MVSELPTNVMDPISSSSSSSRSTIFQYSLPSYSLPFKLDHDNYVLWKTQILPIIIGSNMEGFITREVTFPEKTIIQVTHVADKYVENVILNPEYQIWRRAIKHY